MSDLIKALAVVALGGTAIGVVYAVSTSQKRQRVEARVRRLYAQVVNELGLTDAPPLIFDSRVPNAASVNAQWIMVNPDWAVGLDSVLQQAGAGARRAAWLIILLHELGHHIDGHSTVALGAWCNARAPWCEWDADAFAAHGAVRMKVSPDEAAAVLLALGDGCSLSHGCSRDRVARIVEIIDNASNPFLAHLPVYNGLAAAGFPLLG